jgi:hypothetical protein
MHSSLVFRNRIKIRIIYNARKTAEKKAPVAAKALLKVKLPI